MEYKKGQIWEYKTRKGEENSTITILKMEKDCVHIKINNINIPTKNINTITKEKIKLSSIAHIPISLKLFDKSITKYRGMTKEKLSLEGYKEWKKQKGGIFTLSISKIVDNLQEVFNQ